MGTFEWKRRQHKSLILSRQTWYHVWCHIGYDPTNLESSQVDGQLKCVLVCLFFLVFFIGFGTSWLHAVNLNIGPYLLLFLPFILSPGILAVYHLSAQCIKLFCKKNIEFLSQFILKSLLYGPLCQLLLLTLLYDSYCYYAYIFYNYRFNSTFN